MITNMITMTVTCCLNIFKFCAPVAVTCVVPYVKVLGCLFGRLAFPLSFLFPFFSVH